MTRHTAYPYEGPPPAPDDPVPMLTQKVARGLAGDARFGDGVVREMGSLERHRLQTAGIASASLHAAPDTAAAAAAGPLGRPAEFTVAAAENDESLDVVFGRLLRAEGWHRETPAGEPTPMLFDPVDREPHPSPPGLVEAERFLKELEAQPRDDADTDGGRPSSELEL